MISWKKNNIGSYSFDELNKLEWLVGNGNGSYASGTVSGAISRSYHGLLVASLHPPVERRITVSKVDEAILIYDKAYELGSNVFNKEFIHPSGYQYLDSFELNHYPTYHYQTPDVNISKTIIPIHGTNISLIKYAVGRANKSFKLEVQPFVAAKDFHHVSRKHDDFNHVLSSNKEEIVVQAYHKRFSIYIKAEDANFISEPNWYYNFSLERESDRGLPDAEDLYCPGKFCVALNEGDVFYMAISLESLQGVSLEGLHKKDFTTRENAVKIFNKNPLLKRLAIAADQFIVKRGEAYSILAGYHWFSDWGRDAMIALPGLCLVTGKYAIAKSIIDSFIKHISEGMIPNRFPDYNESPEYNTIDASLWLFNACYKYYEYTKDLNTIVYWIPFLEQVITSYVKGTRYKIGMDEADYLVSGGDHGVQLTWMDAKIGDWVVTPRSGKCVEINALWFNAISVMEYFHDQIGNVPESKDYGLIASKIKENFKQKFLNTKTGALYDFISSNEKNDDIRPNQLYALALPFPVIDKDAGCFILNQVKKELLTSRGLRSLNQEHLQYQPYYGGDVWKRDSAYHQGTVWSFLIGAYVDALHFVEGDKAKEEMQLVVRNMIEHLDEAGLGTISEIFDGNYPHKPNGCIAQAWSVAELLRVIVEYDINDETLVTKKVKSKAKTNVKAH